MDLPNQFTRTPDYLIGLEKNQLMLVPATTAAPGRVPPDQSGGLVLWADSAGVLVIKPDGSTGTIGGVTAWGQLTGSLPDQTDLWSALGGVATGGASDETVDGYDAYGRVSSLVIDGLTWAVSYISPTDNRIDTETSGSLVRTYSYDAFQRFLGLNSGPKKQGGALFLTAAQMLALSPTVPGLHVVLTDTYPFSGFIWNGTRFNSPAGRFRLWGSGLERILHGCNGGTYSQSGNTVTITLTGHTFTAALDNGAWFHVTPSSGTLATGWLTDLTYVDANTFTCQSSVPATTSGNLAAQTSAIVVEEFTLKGGMMGPNGELSGWVQATAGANNANAKTLRVNVGGTTVLNPSLASTLTIQTPFRLQNRNNVAKQIGFGTASSTQNGSSSGGPNPYTINTAADVTIQITMQLATNTDNMKFMGGFFDLLQG